MLLCKIDGEMNVHNCGFSTKLQNGGDMLHDWRQRQLSDSNGSCHGLAPLFFDFLKSWHVADIKNIAGDDQATLMVELNSAIYVCLRLQDRNKHSGGSSTADGGFRRSLTRHVADVKNIAGVDQDLSKFVITKIYAYEI